MLAVDWQARSDVEAFARLAVTERVLDAVASGGARKVGGLWGGSAALCLAALQRHVNRPILVITADDGDAVDLGADLESFGCRGALHLPTLRFDADGAPDPTSFGARARTLLRWREPPTRIALSAYEALLQPAPEARDHGGGRTLRVGESLSQDALLAACQKAGMRHVSLVIAPGEVSRRGDVLDLFPLEAEHGLRLEFFDDELEGIRTFDPANQRSLEVLQEATVRLGGGPGSGAGTTVPAWKHLPKAPLLARYEPLRIEERIRDLLQFDTELRKVLRKLDEALRPHPALELSALPSHDLDYKILSAGTAAGSAEADPLGRIRAVRGMRGRLHVFCGSDSEIERLETMLAHRGVSAAQERLSASVGTLSRGFRISELDVTFLSNAEFAGAPARSRSSERPAIPSRAVQSFFELGPGDLVVHAVHGIARFEGMELVERGDAAEDHLRLRFKDDVALLVPASKIHLVQKFIGAGGSAPPLDKLGGKGFARRVAAVEQSLFDLAAELLEVQANRERLRRVPFPPDDLEEGMLDAFPFEDTEDQASAWKEIRGDLEGDAPMDRLLCGDVGFGKTEIALRAAFRVAVHGRQVAILVPTTLLAEQHGHTFAQRLAPLGVRAESLSRFRPAKERRQVLADTKAGSVDVLVGTHKILGKDVGFADLGLLIIDEEQRFGVRHKEHLKRMRNEVDVLTLSATPIPRTLHSSLLGLRSISTLGTPPAGRRDVITQVAFTEPAILREALHRELGRGGQVYWLHNRIDDLEVIAGRVRELAPGASVAIGHGQMSESEIDKTVRRFVRGDVDVLVCTTIVENGLDIPRANTIVVERADRFGLAELHQIRGRVGRASTQAYCYLLMDRAAPPSADAKKRLKALEEFSHLGAGFAIAMKDLEIRGAGNLLGPQQSGHIAAVGYEMYCQLLRQAVEDAKDRSQRPARIHEVDVDLKLRAFLPESFAAEPKQRLELLRQMDEAVDAESAAAIRSDLTDRFGKLPNPVATLLRVFQLKHALAIVGVRSLQWVDSDRLVAHHPADQPLGGGWLDSFADVRQVEAGRTHLILPKPPGKQRKWTGERLLDALLSWLTG